MESFGALQWAASSLPISAAAMGTAGAVAASLGGLAAARSGAAWEAGRSAAAACCAPPSSCDGCGRRLSAAEIVPVLGWLFARGRCRSCGTLVPKAYPASEAAGFAAGAACAWAALGDVHAMAALAVLLAAGAVLSWIDAVTHVIPEEITWVLLFAGLLASPFEPDAFARAAGAAACCGAMWASLAAVGWMKGEDTRAGGDVALAAAAGAWLGIEAAPWFLAAAAAAYVAYALPLRLRGTVWVPMGPALSAALVLVAAAIA